MTTTYVVNFSRSVTTDAGLDGNAAAVAYGESWGGRLVQTVTTDEAIVATIEVASDSIDGFEAELDADDRVFEYHAR